MVNLFNLIQQWLLKNKGYSYIGKHYDSTGQGFNVQINSSVILFGITGWGESLDSGTYEPGNHVYSFNLQYPTGGYVFDKNVNGAELFGKDSQRAFHFPKWLEYKNSVQMVAEVTKLRPDPATLKAWFTFHMVACIADIPHK